MHIMCFWRPSDKTNRIEFENVYKMPVLDLAVR